MKTVSDKYITMEQAEMRRPVELYHIWRDGGVHWRYTSGDAEVVYGGNTYERATISRGGVTHDSSFDVSTITIQAARVLNPIVEFIAQNPVEVLWIEVLKLHRDQVPLEASVVFIGQIKGARFKGVKVEVEGVGFELLLRQPVPKFRYQPTCNNTLYDTRCGLNKAVYAMAATLTFVSPDGLELEATEFATHADGYFTEGYLKFGDAKRMITEHDGNTVKIRYMIVGLAVGGAVTVYPGCDKSVKTCNDKFSNVNNFFGFPYIPLENPVTRS